MHPQLKQRLIKAATAGATTLVLAGVFTGWFEGTGPTVKQKDGSVLYRPYVDPVGVLTVCRGVTAASGYTINKSKLYTEAECHDMEQKALDIAERGARAIITHYDSYDKWMQVALISFTYNFGTVKLAGSTMAKLLNGGQYEAGCRELDKWVKGRVKGQLQDMPGLVLRRDAEEELCMVQGGTLK